MISVFLYGQLSKQFGDRYRLAVKSPVEACRALEANNPGKFYTALHGNQYRIVRGGDLESGEEIGEDMLDFQSEQTDLHFVPIIAGSKSGWTQAVLGVALIAAAVMTAGVASGAYAAGFSTMEAIAGGAMGTSVMGMSMSSVAMFGAMMTVSGIATMLSPTPQISGGGGVTENVDPRKSFVFTGAENVNEQGVPVPVGYGEFEVGSVVISRSLTVENL